MNFKKLLIAFVLLVTHSFTSFGQITTDGLNNTTTLFTLTGGAYYTGNSAAGDRPATSPFATEGTHSRGIINGTSTLVTTNINTVGYAAISSSFRLASFSISSTANGAEVTDVVTVEISPDGGINYYSTVRVLGNNNAYWAYSASGIATTAYDGNATPADFSPAGGGNRTADGYSTVEVTGLPAVTNLRVRITMLNNSANEQWVMDDFRVLGTLTALCSTPTAQTSSLTTSNVTTTGADLSWTDGASASGTIVGLRLTANANATPVASTNYTPTLNFATAAGANLINANNVVVAKNSAETVTGITGLAPGTQYTATPYAYNGSGTNVCFNTTNPESLSFWTLANEPTTPIGSFTCGAPTTTSIILNFPAANTITNVGASGGYFLVYRESAAPTGFPVDGTIYAGGSTIGDATVRSPAGYIPAAATTITVSGLNGGTTYYFALIPYGAVTGPIASTVNYRTGTPITGFCNTSPAPEINVRGIIGSNPTITDGDITPSGLDNTLFTTVVVASSQSKTFRIENTGNANLNVSNITLTGVDPGDFAISGISLPATIAGGAFLDFTITFTPTAAGTRTAIVTIVNTDANEANYDFVVQGTGTTTPIVEINVKGNGQSIPDNSIYPQGTNWTFFPVTLQGSSSTRIFTIENLGTTPLSLTGASPYIQITGAHATLFTVSIIPSNSIAGNSTTTFQITFSPTSGGAKNATITIFNNDTDEAVYNFNISGTCQGNNNIYVSGNGYDVPKASVTTSTTNLTNFGLIAVTTGVKQNTFVITNLSGATRYLSNVSVSGADAAMFTVVAQPNNGAFANGNTTSFTVNFTPTSAGVKNTTVNFNVYTNSGRTTLDLIDPVFTFAVSGEGIVYTSCTNNPSQTIVVQDFEVLPATPTWGYTPVLTDAVTAIAGGTFNNGSVPVNAFIGAKSYQFKGATTGITGSAVLTMNSVDVSQFNNIDFSMRVAAFRVSGTSQGLDVNDLVQVETSTDGGVNWSVESVLRGYTNSRWSFAATGNFNAYYTGNNSGSTIDTRLGNAELTGSAGISTYYVKNLPQSTALLIRITLNVDRTDEMWALDNIKIEGQTPQSTTWNGSNWSAGFPTPSTKAIIDTGTIYTTVTDIAHGIGSIEACELQIKSGATVTVDANYYFEIQSNITNDGILNVANNGSLVQVNDTAVNKGDINYERNVTSLRGYDYIYWSSPVLGQPLGSLYSSTTPGLKYEWNPIALNPSGSYGFWIAPVSSTMEVAKGYIIRASSSYGWTGSFTSKFTGQPNNGVISPTLSRIANSAVVNDRWNLIGNPYPSALDAKAFLVENAVTNPNIDGFIGLWKHLNAPVSPTSPYYSTYQYNYTNDYLIYNRTGAQTQNGFDGYVASGQAFFVNLLQGTTTTSTIKFKNAFRNKSYDNSQFLRTSQNEEGRIWLDLVNSANMPVRSLIGYVDGATQERDRLYDAITTIGINNSIHSVIDTEIFVIQGRPIPFDTNDQVPLGYNATVAGNYKIAIAGVDGLFTQDQPIYLEDKLLSILHDLRQSPYTFDSAVGVFNDRFVLRYTATALGNSNFETLESSVIVSTKNNELTINSYIETIQDVTIYDILGRQLLENKSIANNTFVASNISMSQQALIVKIKLVNGLVVTRKIIL
ncbi:choice-of-anchor D domain-containing protein [Flavobacterium sp.]|uniref:choice-of-anchor D domain-containing protein n=1 Tax=Flavobacterium sp. TaxID=239 RepID=UPI002489CF6E|nr:choice-of-anchor D domain-containing protein [Flavobacterium sp.]MDI1318381.1 choice-of-anchor D domain-containing protein [Flavobacterium sp.]